MPNVAKKGDLSSGHSCFAPAPINKGLSANVFINGKSCALKGSGFSPHVCGLESHSGTVSSGSKTVFVNEKPIARVMDKVKCQGVDSQVIITGSEDVYSGENIDGT